MKHFKGKSFADVYRDSLNSLYNSPNYESCPRGLSIKEDINVVLEIENPNDSLYINDRRSSQFKYIAAEFMWYFLGRNDVDYISKHASFWKAIQNGDGTANSAYGKLIFNNKNKFGVTQYQWAIDSLIKDPDSRQAIMHFNSENHQYSDNKDFVCTIYSIFHIRDNKLNFTVKMRSNDAILGLPTDVAFFTMLQKQALLHLREKYPNLELGTYSHHIDSFHIYERHFNLVSEMLNFEFIPSTLPELKSNLISKTGEPSKDLLELENSDNAYTDPTYKWIKSYLSNPVLSNS